MPVPEMLGQRFFEVIDERVAKSSEAYQKKFLAQVVALGTGPDTGKARIRRPADPEDLERPFSPLLGRASVGEWVWCVADTGTTLVLGGAGGSKALFEAVVPADVGGLALGWTTVPASQKVRDEADWYSTANYRFTPREPGVYLLGGGCRISSTVDAKGYVLSIWKNGVEYRRLAHLQASGPGTIMGSGAAHCEANGTTDYFELRVWQDFGTATLAAAGGSAYFYGGRA